MSAIEVSIQLPPDVSEGYIQNAIRQLFDSAEGAIARELEKQDPAVARLFRDFCPHLDSCVFAMIAPGLAQIANSLIARERQRYGHGS